jgi:hypothetical protein
LLTFFSAGSWTVSASLLRAFRICEAATLVDVFSKAYIACLVSNPFMFVQIALKIDGESCSDDRGASDACGEPLSTTTRKAASS